MPLFFYKKKEPLVALLSKEKTHKALVCSSAAVKAKRFELQEVYYNFYQNKLLWW
jgi:hypothetical protein